MRNLLVVLILLSFLCMPAVVQAQAPIHLDTVSVDLWPEYDQPGLLVIYHIQLAHDTTLPVTIPFRVPASAQINAVAIVDSDKGLINAPYQSVINGNWSNLSITINSLQFQVEYYVSLVKNGPIRNLIYEWPGDLPVDTLDVNFLLPPASDQVKITPSPTTIGPGQGGLTNYLMRMANLAAGQLFTVNIEYLRQTDELSIASLPVQAVSTPGANTPGQTSTPGLFSWILGGLGVLLIAGGVVGFFGWKRGPRVSAKRAVRKSDLEENQSEVIYCGECGKRAQPGDIFCRTCGARLKTE